MFPALIKGTPLVWYDTIDYANALPLDDRHRAMGYSGFTLLFTLNGFLSLWVVVFVQCSLVVNSLFRFFKYFLSIENPLYLLACIIILSLCTQISYFGSLIMSENFSLILLIESSIILFKWKELSTKGRWYCSSLTSLSLISHNSHVPILLISLFLLFIFIYLVDKKQMKEIALKPIMLAFLFSFTFMFCVKQISTNNVKNKFWTFLYSRMLYDNEVQETTRGICQNKDLFLCNHQDEIQKVIDFKLSNHSTYLWYHFPKTLGDFKWSEPALEEYKTIILKTIYSDPLNHLSNAFSLFRKQIFPKSFFDEHICFTEEHTLVFYDLLYKRYPNDLRKMLAKDSMNQCFPKYMRNVIEPNIKTMSIVIPYLLLFLVIYFSILYIKSKDKRYSQLLLICFFIIINAFLCSYISGPFARYHLKLQPFVLICFLAFLKDIKLSKKLTAL